MINKIVVFSVMILSLFPTVIFAQTQEEVEADFPFAYTQSVVRNSDGQLIVYQENYSPRVSNPQIFLQFLEEQVESGNAEIIVFDTGIELLNMYQLETSEVFEFDQLRAWDNLVGKMDGESYNLAIIFHEGYQVSEGDVLTITWSFVRQNV